MNIYNSCVQVSNNVDSIYRYIFFNDPCRAHEESEVLLDFCFVPINVEIEIVRSVAYRHWNALFGHNNKTWSADSNLKCLKNIWTQMPRSDTLIHTTTFAEGFSRCFWDTRLLSRTPPCETICGFFCFVFFAICLISGLGSTARLHTGGGELWCFSSSDTVCPEQCVLKKNKY